MSGPRFQSTGKPAILEPTEDAVAELRRARLEQNPAVIRKREWDKIEKRVEAKETSADDRFTQACNAAEYAHPEVFGSPGLKMRFVAEYSSRAHEAAQKGEVIDWSRELSTLADKVKQRAGLPTTAQRDRAESLDELKSSRGQK